MSSANGREAGLAEGIAIAREMLERVRPYVQGIQVSAPFGKVAFALQVFDAIESIDPDVIEVAPDDVERLGFVPPAVRGRSTDVSTMPSSTPEPV